MSENQLETLPDFSGTGRLRTLAAHTNKLTGIPDFNHLPYLGSLILGQNLLSHVPDFSHLDRLWFLDLSGNPLTRLPALTHLPSIEYVDFSDTQIQCFEPGAQSLCGPIFVYLFNVNTLPNSWSEFCADGSGACTLPGAWQEQPIGGVTSSAAYDWNDQEWRLTTSGYAPALQSDGAGFAFRELCGDGVLIAHLQSLEAQGGAPGFAGLMIRESLEAGDRQVSLVTKLGNMVYRRVRMTPGAALVPQQIPRFGASWLKLERNGSQFTGYTSSNGMSWQLAFQTTLNTGDCVLAGLMVESTSVNAITHAVFDQVTVSGGEMP